MKIKEYPVQFSVSLDNYLPGIYVAELLKELPDDYQEPRRQVLKFTIPK